MNSPDEEIFPLRPPRADGGSPPRVRGKPFVIMYHGSLVERNGLDLAIEAFERVRDSIPGSQLRIYGWATPFLARVMDSVRAKGLEDAVHVLGPRRAEDMVAAIEECDVGIIPNRRSVFTEISTPTRIFEYLALGKPAIAPRVVGIQDYFNNESLIFFELGNAEDLARQIAYVFFHPGEAAEIVKRGQEVYLTHAWREEKHTLVKLASDLLSHGSVEEASLNRDCRSGRDQPKCEPGDGTSSTGRSRSRRRGSFASKPSSW